MQRNLLQKSETSSLERCDVQQTLGDHLGRSLIGYLAVSFHHLPLTTSPFALVLDYLKGRLLINLYLGLIHKLGQVISLDGNGIHLLSDCMAKANS